MVNSCDKSSWWFYFERAGKTKAKCKHCPAEIDQGATKSTSKLEWHLKTIDRCLVALQSRSLTIGAVLPFFLGLKKKLRDPLQPPETFELCDAIVAKLDSLFSGWESKKFLICATVLDPRVKLNLFEHLRERARACFACTGRFGSDLGERCFCRKLMTRTPSALLSPSTTQQNRMPLR
uniref:BED-type domain-containing protein n=1 Tax=Globodera rostochiensis TaxID=31243 RepID=A0A914GUV9_GLORO